MENGEARQKLEEKRATDERARSGVQPFLGNCPEKMPSRTSRNDFATRSCYKSARCTKQPYQNQPRTKSRRVMRGDLQQIIDHNRSRKEYCSTTFGVPSTACAYLISKVQRPLEEPQASRLTWSDP